MVVLSGVERQQPHQMQRVGVIGIDRERLLAADLGIEPPSGPPVGEPGIVQRLRRVGVSGPGSGPGFSCGRAPFVPVHLISRPARRY